MNQNNHNNDKPFKAYTEEDFQYTLSERFPDGMTLSVKDLEAEHLYNYFHLNTFDGETGLGMNIGKNISGRYPVSLLKAEVRIKPEDYCHIEAGYDGVVDINYYDVLEQEGVEKDDYVNTYIMNEYPDLNQAPVTVDNKVVAKSLWVEGLHFHDALAVAIKKPKLEDYEMKSLLQLKAIYTRGVKFLDEGWQMTADVAQMITSPDEWRREFEKTNEHYEKTTGRRFTDDEINKAYDAAIKRQAKVSLQNAGVMDVVPKTYTVFIEKTVDEKKAGFMIRSSMFNELDLNGRDEAFIQEQNTRMHKKLDELADEFNGNYLEESFVEKAAYAVHPDNADYLLVNINTNNPIRHHVAESRMKSIEGYDNSFEIKYENIYKSLHDVPQDVIKSMDIKTHKVNADKAFHDQLMYYVNNGGAYFYQRNTLGYVHISTDRTMHVNGEPLSRKNMEKLHQLAADGNIVGHRGTEHRTLFGPPRHPQQRLMMDNSNGAVQHMTVQYDFNRKQMLTSGYRVVDPSRYTDITERIGNVSVYGNNNRIFLRAVIDGQQQPGKMLTNAQKSKLNYYVTDFTSEESHKYLKLMAGQVYQAELEQNTAVKQSQDEQQSNGFKR